LTSLYLLLLVTVSLKGFRVFNLTSFQGLGLTLLNPACLDPNSPLVKGFIANQNGNLLLLHLLLYKQQQNKEGNKL
jgi:hypothetical protein